MKRLLLMRHAKSSWADTDLPDEQRPLNERGRATAVTMANWLGGRGDSPDVVITSSAERSRETWERIKAQLGLDEVQVIVQDSLYSSGPSAMLKALSEVPEDAERVLMIGHQPVVSSFARKLANDDVPSACKRAYKKFPTGAVAVIDLPEGPWADVAFGSGDFKRFACPKELVEA